MIIWCLLKRGRKGATIFISVQLIPCDMHNLHTPIIIIKMPKVEPALG